MKKIIFLTLLLNVMFAGSALGLVPDPNFYAPMENDHNDIIGFSPWVVDPAVGGTPHFNDSTTHPDWVRWGDYALEVNTGASLPGIEYTHAIDTGQFSIALWIGQETVSTGSDIVNMTGPSSFVQICEDSDGCVQAWFELPVAGEIYIETDILLGDPDFNHIVVTYDAHYLRIYVDGALAAESVDFNEALPTMDNVLVGIQVWIPPMEAAYDEVKIYNYGLTSGEVTTLYQSYIGPDEPPTITDHPDSQIVNIGDPVTLTVAATNPYTGGSTGLEYLWYKDGSPTSETTNTLSIASVVAGDLGDYYCQVTLTANGQTADSDVATLIAGLPPQLILHAPMDNDPNDIALPASTLAASPAGDFVFVASDKGQALQVDGTASNPGVIYSDEIDLNTGAFAVSLWVGNELSSADINAVIWNFAQPAYYQCFAYYVPVDIRGALGLNTGHGSFITSDSSFIFKGPGFKHIVVTYDGVDLSLYVDGVARVLEGVDNEQVGTVINIGVPYIGMSCVFRVGVQDGLLPPLFADYDEVRLYNYGLSAEQVTYLYTGQLVCVDPPAYDVTGDCKVNLEDLAASAGEWLANGLEEYPEL